PPSGTSKTLSRSSPPTSKCPMWTYDLGEPPRWRLVVATLPTSQLERDIIHERTMAGLLAARAQGRGGGRPTVMDEDKLAAARARRAHGESPTEIARALSVSRASVYRHLAAAES
ncbi:MAG: helix-turn-helix domain-containing protein, partial [Streptosporangiaceae bacterium]